MRGMIGRHVCNTIRWAAHDLRLRFNVRLVRKKVATTTFQYDDGGNVVQKTTDGTTTTYVYDYADSHWLADRDSHHT
jgi:hypothetical protein